VAGRERRGAGAKPPRGRSDLGGLVVLVEAMLPIDAVPASREPGVSIIARSSCVIERMTPRTFTAIIVSQSSSPHPTRGTVSNSIAAALRP